jgi:hypothetical protein
VSKSQTDNPVLIVIIVALFGGLLGMLIGAWVADFNFYNRFSPAMMVVATGHAGEPDRPYLEAGRLVRGVKFPLNTEARRAMMPGGLFSCAGQHDRRHSETEA